jgi:hypothetical protein
MDFSGRKTARMVKKLEWIEMAQLAVSSIVFKSLSLKLPYHLQSSFHDSVTQRSANEFKFGPKSFWTLSDRI